MAEYRIDLVVEDTGGQLAVECDGDEWHGIEQYESDVARQRILERCGWRFWRIRGHEYYRDPVDAVEPLWKLLSDMGIRSALSSEFDSTVSSKDKEMVEPLIVDGESSDTLEDLFRWFYSDGLIELFMAKSPIQHASRGLELSFVALEFREPAHTEVDCQKLGLTYASPLYARTRLLIKNMGEIKEQDLYLADIPMITQKGTFIIDGIEKTLIIDSLTNRSLDQSPIDKGLENLKSTALTRMSRISLETVTPARLIDIRPLGTAITEFFMESRERA